MQHFAPLVFSSSFVVDNWIDLLPSFLAPLAASFAEQLGRGSVLSSSKIRLYRNEGSMLSSLEDFWRGYVGYQSFPWMGVCDDVAIWTQSGEVFENWLDKSGDIVNSHLPFVMQESNVALIMYKPNSARLCKDVALFWEDSRFDQVMMVQGAATATDTGILGLLKSSFNLIFGYDEISGGSWVLGRRGDSYIAVHRPCGDRKDQGWFACEGNAGRQVWATVVGDKTKHGSFEGFASRIEGATVEESVTNRWFQAPVYTATVSVDGTIVSHDW